MGRDGKEQGAAGISRGFGKIFLGRAMPIRKPVPGKGAHSRAWGGLGIVLHGMLVGARGFEPPAYGTQNRRATRLRYAPDLWLSSD